MRHVSVLFPIFLRVLLLPASIEDDQCVDEDIVIKIVGSRQSAQLFKDFGNFYRANSSVHKRTVTVVYIQSDKTFWHQMANKSTGDTAFVLSEIPPTQNEERDHPELLTFPVMVGTLAFIYNLGNVTNTALVLTQQVIAGIFVGNITYWNDSAIEILNPDLQMPSEKIIVCAKRMNDSNDMDTEFLAWLLSMYNDNWRDEIGLNDWPPTLNHSFFRQTAQMVPFISATPFSLGYASWDNLYNKQNPPPVASVRTASYGMSDPSLKYVLTTELYLAKKNNFSSYGFKLLNEIGASIRGYPFIHFAYVIINRTLTGINCCTAQEALGFIDFLTSDLPANGKNTTWSKYGYYPLKLDTPDRRNLMYSISCNGSIPFKSYEDSRATATSGMLLSDNWKLVLIISASVVSVLVGLMGFIYYRKWYKVNDETLWVIPASEIIVNEVKSNVGLARSRSSVYTIGSANTNMKQSPEFLQEKFNALLGLWKKNDSKVFLKELPFGSVSNFKRSTKRLAYKFVRDYSHPNLCLLHGISVIQSKVNLVTQECAKGTLHYVLKTCPFDLLLDIKFSLANNVLSGLKYLHDKLIVHGQLNSVGCYVDDLWNVKISNWSTYSIVSNESKKPRSEKFDPETASFVDMIELLYLDPDSMEPNKPTLSSDVYSFGMLLIEIFSGKLPYYDEIELGSTTYTEVIQRKFKERFDPQIPHDMPEEIRKLVSSMMNPTTNRPDMSTVAKDLNQNHKNANKSIVDVMMKLMEKHMEDLEEKVIERTSDLQAVTNRMKELLNEMLPPQIATKFINGETVAPEFFECATIFFSDIVGFTTISARSTPFQVMSFLNHLWMLFDATVCMFDCYKVDTIGDAYMVASGLPQRNGICHCKNVANFALTLLTKTSNFTIPHLPQENLRIRMGINSGPVTAGVIGHKMPQYCIFGDTVNTASRMESTSLPLKIQVSELAHNLMEQYFPEFSFDLRGEIEVKGKGMMKTFWLLDVQRTV